MSLILEYIPVGKENRISTAELIQLTGYTSRRICKDIERARLDGMVILSASGGGYWLPDLENPDKCAGELCDFIRFMQGKDTHRTTAGAIKLLHQIDSRNQTTLFNTDRERLNL